jgi:hypothetical protein
VIHRAPQLAILGFTSEYASSIGVDTTDQSVLDIGTGAAGAEVRQLQFPFNIRNDTQVGYYKSVSVFLPEPYLVSAGTRLSVRVASSPAIARTHQAIRLLVDVLTEDGPLEFGTQVRQAVNRSAVR